MKKTILITIMTTLIGANIASCTAQSEEPAATQSKSDTEVVINNIMSRRSIRKYKDLAVGRDALDKIIECGINAPNGMNQQNYEVKVVNDPASTKYLSENLNGLYPAPVYFFIAAGNQYDMSPIDCGLLSENICLAATAYGLGSINLGLPVRALKEKPEILKKLGFSDNYNISLVLALGYPDEAPAAKPRNAEKVQFITVSE